MALGKNRAAIFVRGPGNLRLLQKLPTAWTAYQGAGYLKNTTIDPNTEMELLIPETGHVVDWAEKSRAVTLKSMLMQSGIDEINLVKDAGGKLYAVQYSGEIVAGGAFQYFLFNDARLKSGAAIEFRTGERGIPIELVAVKDTSLSYDLPEWAAVETARKIEVEGLVFWISPRIGLNYALAQILDISGFGLHGTISTAYATIWQAGTPAYFLRFDGTDDYVSFGDVLDDDGTGDFCIECWIRVQGSDGALQEILSKRAGMTNEAGFHLVRNASNVIEFEIGSGAAAAQAVSTSTVLQNVWKHVAVTIDRNGNAQVYVNGTADGSPAAVSSIATDTNAVDLYLARLASAYGQVDIGDVRVYRWSAGGLPTTIATMLSRHFTGERSYYGV